MFGTGAKLLAGTMAALCLVLIGPSAPSGALVSAPLPAGAADDVVPNRVITWNICNPCGSGNNAGRAAEIATYAPQVIGLQEACVRDVEEIRDRLKRFYGLTYHVKYGSVLRNWGRCGGWPWRPGGFGQAILSAAPMTDHEVVEYPEGGSEDRGYMAVTTKVGGRPVRVFATHLAERRQEAVRATQVPVLAAEVARYERAVVLGDFNATPSTPELRRMWDVATAAGRQCRASLETACEPTTDWHLKFDYVFLRGIDALAHRVHPSPYSDHHLMQADLKPIPGGPST
ncbi:endonuclease/exonuclease/phosphatase family protein [Streptomyces sp. SID14478]|nr:endonuclease/exonuclease/phosphatase family protein [Streptomyces sp. SID14478]